MRNQLAAWPAAEWAGLTSPTCLLGSGIGGATVPCQLADWGAYFYMMAEFLAAGERAQSSGIEAC